MNYEGRLHDGEESFLCFSAVMRYYCKKRRSLQRILRTISANWPTKTANITKDDITLQHIAKLSLCLDHLL